MYASSVVYQAASNLFIRHNNSHMLREERGQNEVVSITLDMSTFIFLRKLETMWTFRQSGEMGYFILSPCVWLSRYFTYCIIETQTQDTLRTFWRGAMSVLSKKQLGIVIEDMLTPRTWECQSSRYRMLTLAMMISWYLDRDILVTPIFLYMWLIY